MPKDVEVILDKMNLVESATQRIKAMVVDGQYDERGYLPCEGKLCSLLGVSRSTIRESIRSLEVRGFVKRIHGKGIMVVDNSAGVLTQTMVDVMSMGCGSIADLIEVRNVIETSAAMLASKRATSEDIDRMRRNVALMDESQAMNADYIQADLDFHLAMMHAVRNPFLNAIVEAYTPLLKDTIVAASQADECIEHRFRYHANILDAIEAKDGIRAESCMRLHLKATARNALTASVSTCN